MRESNGTDTIWYYYDAGGSVTVFELNGVTYYYVKNIQGDIVAIIDENGAKVVEYFYNSWGKLISTTGTLVNTVGEKNPYRYRGYRYDAETGLYYLNSRYYDPEIKRWWNSDSQINTSLGLLGMNLFTYCLNSPINTVDYGGNKPGDLFDTMDEAARDFANYINAKSISDNREYASYIYTKTVIKTRTVTYVNPNAFGKGIFSKLWNALFGKSLTKTVTKKVKVIKYTYREPSRGGAYSAIIPINWFGIHNVVGQLHTHAAYDSAYKNDIFSPDDIKNSKNAGVPSYLATPLGTLSPSKQKCLVNPVFMRVCGL